MLTRPSLLLVLTACAPQPIQLTLQPDVCPVCPDPVMVETEECARTKKVLVIRNDRHLARLDACEQKGNDTLACIWWVYGSIGPKEEE